MSAPSWGTGKAILLGRLGMEELCVNHLPIHSPRCSVLSYFAPVFLPWVTAVFCSVPRDQQQAVPLLTTLAVTLSDAQSGWGVGANIAFSWKTEFTSKSEESFCFKTSIVWNTMQNWQLLKMKHNCRALSWPGIFLGQ